MAPLFEKEIPWCTAFLCLGAMVSHTLVFVGNMDTAKSLTEMGHSVDGWSEVGLATSTALSSELDALLSNVSFVLTRTVERTMKTQEMIDGLLSSFAETTGTMLDEIMLNDPANGLLLLQQSTGQNTTDDPIDIVMPRVMEALSALPDFQEGLTHLHGIIEHMKPALLQVGEWVETFSDKVQATVETFGTTMDRVQKIFDQLMTQMSGVTGEGEDLMLHDTFNLFDMDGSGKISAEDLHVLAEIYSVMALAGENGPDLVKHYDVDGDSEIDMKEFPNLVEDSSITGIMATVLREYAKRLSMVAGNVGAARMRAEVSLNVVQYFQLVCSKNLTKVGWVSQMLTNGTLPIEFTADVMAQLALEKDDPNILTDADVGQIVVGTMMTLNSTCTLQAVELMSTPEHWDAEGFNLDDQPAAVETVTKWTSTGKEFVKSLKETMGSLRRDAKMHGEKLPAVGVQDVAQAMPEAARYMAQDRVQDFKQRQVKERMQKRLELFGTQRKQTLLVELLHGVAATDGGAPESATRALKKGKVAQPETLLFAQWLKNNATTTANRFQQQCFDYTGQSSNALDAFNTRIQGMVKKLSGFLDIMKAYATPAGIDKLEAIVEDFASNGMNDIWHVLKDVIRGILQGKHVMLPAVPVQQVLVQTDTYDEELPIRPRLPGNFSSSIIAASAFMRVKTKSVSLAAPRPHDPSSVRRARDQHEQGHFLSNVSFVKKRAALSHAVLQLPGVPAALVDRFSGVWDKVSNLLREFESIVPQALETMRNARTEVSATSSTMESLFGTLKSKGQPVFDEAAFMYKLMWVLYFGFVMPLTLALLYYGFWASGYFGGPRVDKAADDGYEAPQGFCAKVSACFCSCGACMRNCHDSHMYLWSFIICYQVFVLLLFVVSLVFVVLAGIQMFVGSGCAPIYLIADHHVCQGTLSVVSTFLQTFTLGDGTTPLSMVCHRYSLLTCRLIHDRLLAAATMTVTGSFIAAFFSFQLVFDAAMKHERIRWRRMLAASLSEKDGGAASSSSA